jgi:F0F1-type ATP synthase membrane subunit b/b'
MVYVTNNVRVWLIGMAVSLGIFLLVYFTVIQPSTNTANQAIKTGLQQSQQALNQAQQQLRSAGATAAGTSTQAQQALNNAQKLTSCVAAAGTDVTKVAACQSQFGR